MKSFIAVSAIFCFISFTYGQVNDTPGGNLTIRFREFPGRCPSLPDAEQTPPTRQMYEGRWYAVRVGFQPTQARSLSCLVWDSFFDQSGILHNFLYGFESGEFRTGITRLTPVRGRDQVYTLETGAQNNDQFISCLYFVDEDIFIFGEVTCRENGNHYRNAVIGVRDLRIAFARSGQIAEILNDLKIETDYEPDQTTISHSRSCSYPPPRRNPYTARPSRPSGGGNYGYGRNRRH